MKKQEYIIKNIKDFNMVHIFECGQCFRWNRQQDGSYTGVIGESVLNVKQDCNNIIFSGVSPKNLKEIVTEYFDLNTNYSEIKLNLSKIDDYMEKSIKYGEGIRILKQDFWECIISFIISANNNIPRIKGIIEKLSKAYGKEIEWNGVLYYTFPTPEELGKATVNDLRGLGLGFRDKRVYDTTKMVLNGIFNLIETANTEDIGELKNKLLELPGVGEKVADCIMLFSLKRFEVFPIDVWVRRVMNQLYIKNENETKVSKKDIKDLAELKYAGLAGIAQQYLFYSIRDYKNFTLDKNVG